MLQYENLVRRAKSAPAYVLEKMLDHPELELPELVDIVHERYPFRRLPLHTLLRRVAILLGRYGRRAGEWAKGGLLFGIGMMLHCLQKYMTYACSWNP